MKPAQLQKICPFDTFYVGRRIVARQNFLLLESTTDFFVECQSAIRKILSCATPKMIKLEKIRKILLWHGAGGNLENWSAFGSVQFNSFTYTRFILFNTLAATCGVTLTPTLRVQGQAIQTYTAAALKHENRQSTSGLISHTMVGSKVLIEAVQ